MRVIINADDFGYSTATNDAICSLMSARKVTSATIMANGPVFRDAVRRIGDFPTCSFGVHLNLTEFRSLTLFDIFYDSGIVNEEGLFTGSLRRTPPSLSLVKAIEKEWGEQIVRVLDHGVSVSHLDSHHHTHTIPWLFVSLKRIQKRFRIGKVRATMNWYYWKEYSPSTIALLSKKAWGWSLRHFYRTRTTDHFTSFQWFIANLRNGERRSHGVAELMCHPGQPWASGETELLWSDWPQQLPFRIDLISYNDL
jgi:predicted glycoside hydrolase/deacetylase ChbG (UPF0249 family)